jgi:hypothetical protein
MNARMQRLEPGSGHKDITENVFMQIVPAPVCKVNAEADFNCVAKCRPIKPSGVDCSEMKAGQMRGCATQV